MPFLSSEFCNRPDIMHKLYDCQNLEVVEDKRFEQYGNVNTGQITVNLHQSTKGGSNFRIKNWKTYYMFRLRCLLMFYAAQ